MSKPSQRCPRNHDERFGLIGAVNGCLACQAEELGKENKSLMEKLIRRERGKQTKVITVRMDKDLHQEIRLAASNQIVSINQWCISALEKAIPKDEGN